LTQADVAAQIGIVQDAVSRWEHGRPPNPRQQTALARILRAPVSVLFPYPPDVT
jgi:transcriptional regulator with XRE-family HTH domain